MDHLRRLEEIFARFPGIGPRQARRFVYHIINKSPASVKEFTDLINEVRKAAHECVDCHRYFFKNHQKTDACSICHDQSRDRSTLLIVAHDSDLESIEKSGAYQGRYFVLGGLVPILDKEPEKRIRLKTLLERVSEINSDLKEIILSLNTTPDGEHTARIVREALEAICSTRVTVLGRGLSTGSELEYVDGETIRNALGNRK